MASALESGHVGPEHIDGIMKLARTHHEDAKKVVGLAAAMHPIGPVVAAPVRRLLDIAKVNPHAAKKAADIAAGVMNAGKLEAKHVSGMVDVAHQDPEHVKEALGAVAEVHPNGAAFAPHLHALASVAHDNPREAGDSAPAIAAVMNKGALNREHAAELDRHFRGKPEEAAKLKGALGGLLASRHRSGVSNKPPNESGRIPPGDGSVERGHARATAAVSTPFRDSRSSTERATTRPGYLLPDEVKSVRELLAYAKHRGILPLSDARRGGGHRPLF